MSYCAKLFRYKNVYDHVNTDNLFFHAVKENTKWHLEHSEEYKSILIQQGFSLSSFDSYNKLSDLPPIPTLYLKRNPIYSMPTEKIKLSSTTSGTEGQPVRIGFDKNAILIGAPMLLRTLSFHKVFSIKPTNYIVLGYQPSKHNKMGAVRTAHVSTYFAPALHKEYALVDTGSDYKLNIDGIKEMLLRYHKQNNPVRIHGFPAYLYFLLKELEKENLRLTMPRKSMVFLGGGWKQFADRQVSKREIYSLTEEWLGIPENQFKEFFGVVEHNVPYCDCTNHHFHVPTFSRVIIRDVGTLKPLPYGEPGLLNLVSPLLKSMPLTSIVTDDLAVLHDGESCGCGITTPFFEILGRAGLRDIKTCAAGASTFLEI